jgi:hypothetical protein
MSRRLSEILDHANELARSHGYRETVATTASLDVICPVIPERVKPSGGAPSPITASHAGSSCCRSRPWWWCSPPTRCGHRIRARPCRSSSAGSSSSAWCSKRPVAARYPRDGRLPRTHSQPGVTRLVAVAVALIVAVGCAGAHREVVVRGQLQPRRHFFLVGKQACKHLMKTTPNSASVFVLDMNKYPAKYRRDVTDGCRVAVTK